MELPLEATDFTANTVIKKHDLSQMEENVTGLPNLLNQTETFFGDLFNQDKSIKSKKSSALFGCLKVRI